MKKLFKWPGGKTSELKRIQSLLPPTFTQVVEPFAGSAALSFHLELPAVINDLDPQVANFYRCLQQDHQRLHDLIESDRHCPYMLRDDPRRSSTRTLEDAYYEARSRLRFKGEPMQEASDFYVTRALAFSGMIRNSSKGGSNVPYGWYRNFKNTISPAAVELVKSWKVLQGSYEVVEPHLTKESFVFLDPPYRGRAGYQTPDWTDEDHGQFLDWVTRLKCKWLLVHSDDPVYRDRLQGYHIVAGCHTYAQNFKGRDNGGSRVGHLYISNYEPPQTNHVTV